MKKMGFILLALLITAPVLADEPDVLFGGKVKHGVFFAPVLKISQQGDNIGIMTGSRCGWILNHSYMIGVGSYQLIGKINIDPDLIDLPDSYDMNYSGLELEYIRSSNRLLHYSIYSLLGAGLLNYVDDDFYLYGAEDVFFVFEPGVNVTLNLHKYIRVNLLTSYRMVADVDLEGLSNKDLNGVNATLTLSFGWF